MRSLMICCELKTCLKRIELKIKTISIGGTIFTSSQNIHDLSRKLLFKTLNDQRSMFIQRKYMTESTKGAHRIWTWSWRWQRCRGRIKKESTSKSNLKISFINIYRVAISLSFWVASISKVVRFLKQPNLLYMYFIELTLREKKWYENVSYEFMIHFIEMKRKPLNVKCLKRQSFMKPKRTRTRKNTTNYSSNRTC